MNCFKQISWKLIWLWSHMRLGHIGYGSKIHPSANIKGSKNSVFLDKNVTICSHTTITCDGNGSTVHIGDDTFIDSYSLIRTCGGNIKIGSRCTIGSFCSLYGHGDLLIGNDVLIATQTAIIPANHIFNDYEIPIRKQGLTLKGIVIEDNVWLGAGTKILDGCLIGKGSVLGAGTVLTKSVEPYSVVVGVPGKVLYKRNKSFT